MRAFVERNFVGVCVVAAMAGALLSFRDGPISILAGAFSGLGIAAAALTVGLSGGRKLITFSRGGDRVFEIVPGYEIKFALMGVGLIGPVISALQVLHIV
jgi:hypothetical protein